MVVISDGAKSALKAMSRYLKYKVIARNKNIEFDITDYVIDISTLDELTQLDNAPFGGVTYNELTITLDNMSGVFNEYVTKDKITRDLNVPNIFTNDTKWYIIYSVEVSNGLFEDIQSGVFYFDTLTIDTGNHTATCTCYDKLFKAGSLPINKFGVVKDIKLRDAYETVLTNAGYSAADYDLSECPDLLLPIFWGVGTTLSEILTNLSISSITNVFVDKTDRIKVTSAMSEGTPADILTDSTNIITVKGSQPYLNTYSDVVVTYNRLVNSTVSEIVTFVDLEVEPGTTVIDNIVVQAVPVEDIICVSTRLTKDVTVSIADVTDSTLTLNINNASDEPQVITVRVYGNIIQTVSSTHSVTNTAATNNNVLQLSLPIATTDAYAKAVAASILQYYNNMLPVIEIDTRANPAWELNDIISVQSDTSNINTKMRIISIDATYSAGYSGTIKLMEVK